MLIIIYSHIIIIINGHYYWFLHLLNYIVISLLDYTSPTQTTVCGIMTKEALVSQVYCVPWLYINALHDLAGKSVFV